jgi:hypothetical protein
MRWVPSPFLDEKKKAKDGKPACRSIGSTCSTVLLGQEKVAAGSFAACRTEEHRDMIDGALARSA